MKLKDLLNQSKTYLQKQPGYIDKAVSIHLFSTGARWMYDKLNEGQIPANSFNTSICYGLYGALKYGICLSCCFAVAMLLYTTSIFLVPLSILVFYFCEAHFLFLFPLLIDKVEQPIWKSIKESYRIGIIKIMITVIPLSCFMLVGLFNIKDPFRNWHIGSLAIIIWYKNEIRNRI